MARTHSIEEAITRIVKDNEQLRSFWESSHGWAPTSAADLLARSRLDRQVSLSHALGLWLNTSPGPDEQGRLILAWTNLGILVEGSIKTFLCVYLDTYRRSSSPIKRKGDILDPDEAALEQLRIFMHKVVWTPGQVEQWDPWIRRVQYRRNAVHAFKDRGIGTFDEFFDDVITYSDFVRELDSQLPYP